MDLESVRSVSVYPRRRPKQLDYIFKSQSKHSSKFISQSKPLFLDVLSEPCIQKLSLLLFIIGNIASTRNLLHHFVLLNTFVHNLYIFKIQRLCFCAYQIANKNGNLVCFYIFAIFHSHSLPIQRIQDLFKFFQI